MRYAVTEDELDEKCAGTETLNRKDTTYVPLAVEQRPFVVQRMNVEENECLHVPGGIMGAHVPPRSASGPLHLVARAGLS